MKGALVWKGSELPDNVVTELTPEEIKEVKDAISDFDGIYTKLDT
jgi:hypothetical protein